MDTYGWLLDPKRCIECRACEAACKQWNGVATGAGVRLRQVRVRESGVFPNVTMVAISGACNHCEDPYCLSVCPVKAITKRAHDGTVLIDTAKCLGCGMCAKFCPHQAPQFNTVTRKMEKCTGCYDRVEVGLQPACAALCPTGALKWGKWDEIYSMGSDAMPGFVGGYTYPHIRFVNDPFPGSGSGQGQARTTRDLGPIAAASVARVLPGK